MMASFVTFGLAAGSGGLVGVVLGLVGGGGSGLPGSGGGGTRAERRYQPPSWTVRPFL